MEYGILGLCICFGALGYAEISNIKKTDQGAEGADLYAV